MIKDRIDPIIEELRQIREEHAKKFNYDMVAMGEDYRKRHEEMVRAGRKVIRIPKRPNPAVDIPATDRTTTENV